MTAGNQPSSSGSEPAPSSPGTADAFLIVKRGLFFRPNCQGYTGIRDEAGRYSEEAARYHAEHGECTLIHADDAPEFMPAAYSDLVIKHLTLQRDEMRREVERLRGVAQASGMPWEHADAANVDCNAFYLVKDNGGEWRDFDLHIMRGTMVNHKLAPNYIRGRPEWIAKISAPSSVPSTTCGGGA